MKNYLFIFCIVCFVICGCGEKKPQINDTPVDDSVAAYGDTFIDSSIADATNLNPLLNSDSPSGDITALVFDGLLHYNTKMELEGLLAKSWRIGFNYNTLYIHVKENSIDKIPELAEMIKKSGNGALSRIAEVDTIEDYCLEKPSIIRIILTGEQEFADGTEIDESKMPAEVLNDLNSLLKEDVQKIIPQLCVEFELNADVKWHDNELFTADDVEFTYQKYIDKKLTVFGRSSFLMVDKCSVLGPYKIKFSYKEIFPRALVMWTTEIIPKHLLANTDIMKSKFSRDPVGTGPFKFQSWQSDEFILLVANKEYFKGRPYFDKYMYRIIPDRSTQFSMLQADPNQIDRMSLTPDQFVKQTDTEEFKSRFYRYNYTTVSGTYTYMGLNLLNPLFADKLTRQAISHAVNREEIIEQIWYGHGKIVTGPFIPGSWAYNNEVKSFDFNLEKSRELLIQAGWKDADGDGILDKNGQKFSFSLITNNGNKVREHVCNIMKANLSKVGIQVDIKLMEWTAYMRTIDNKEFDALVLGWSMSLDPDLHQMWHSSQIPDMSINKAGDNFISYINPEVDHLIDESRATFSREKRTEIFHKLHAIIADEQPYIFLYVGESLGAIDIRVKGIEPSPIGIDYNFTKWYIPKRLQRYK